MLSKFHIKINSQLHAFNFNLIVNIPFDLDFGMVERVHPIDGGVSIPLLVLDSNPSMQTTYLDVAVGVILYPHRAFTWMQMA